MSDQNKKYLGLKILFATMSLGMIGLVIDTSLKSNMFDVLARVNYEPWFTTTLFDFYFNITILSAWVVYKEKHWLSSTLWILGFITLGSIATCFYVLLQLLKLKNNDSLDKVVLRN